MDNGDSRDGKLNTLASYDIKLNVGRLRGRRKQSYMEDF